LMSCGDLPVGKYRIVGSLPHVNFLLSGWVICFDQPAAGSQQFFYIE
jgi:hypothetical protein